MNKKFNVLIVSCGLFLAGCESTSTVSVGSDYVDVKGERFERDQDGNVLLDSDALELFKGQNGVVIIDQVLPGGGIAVSENELQLLSQDSQLLTETIEGEVSTDKPLTFLVKKGSLKENLSRLQAKYTSEENPLMLDYQTADYHIPEAYIVRAPDLDSLVAETLSSFPVYGEIDGFNFFLQAGSLKGNLERLSMQYSSEHEPITLDFGTVDYYVSESKLVNAESVDELVAIILSEFPVFASFEEESN